MFEPGFLPKCGVVADKPVHASGGQRGGEDGHGAAEGEGVGEVEARQGNGQREARRLDKPGQRESQQDGCDQYAQTV